MKGLLLENSITTLPIKPWKTMAANNITVSQQYREYATSMMPLYTSKCAFMRIEAKASTYIHEPHSIVTSATLAVITRPECRIIVGKFPSLCTGAHSRAVCYNSEYSNILHGLTWRHKFVYVSPVNLSRFRLGQFTTTRHILKQHICTLTRLLILILLLIAGIEANPGPNMHYIESNKLKQHYVQYS